MMWFIWLYFALITAEVVFSQEAIQVKCRPHSLVVTWRVTESLTETPFKLLLGDCFPSKFTPTADGGGEAVFHYHFSNCRFRKKETPEELIYENELTFRPLTKSESARLVYHIKCVSERPFPVVKPAFSVLQGEGELTFHMGLLNGDLSGPALSNSFALGSFINIWASVVQQAHQPLMLFLEECVASNSLALEPQSWTYPIVTNKGCLVDAKTGSSRFLPRNQSSTLVLQLQTFKFIAEKEVNTFTLKCFFGNTTNVQVNLGLLSVQVYIHCKLVAWDPEDLNEENKACNYIKSTGKWELLDDPFQNDLCRCCDYDCSQQITDSTLALESQGPTQSAVLGPLLLTSHI